ncbi:RING/FYVE/PHD-type zinc finger family protein [Senna tora]|uniref:RING/FYVE/PHD-type zinc finger family protein n=1 Tax=Senna tora TaxID=362788 RepID=A0A835CC89_9FABA|nr:RING/FYVE/PHD-type zinc finger family protein [Senna tora]
MCNRVENEGSERAKKMLSCKSCGKKYHRNCLRSWAQNRDLFHWSSWTCRACRICEACRRTGDPSKFMFCRRCDGAYHCYCLQPPHKNVSSGPYLCPKHTRCHSCGSNVPGNGLSVRWFLGYTCCDACGRLFVKGNYCPVCLKVYRDSESTPMVCCDVCQRWVHCQCDNISDEKYHQFQVDGNLQYKCPTCRGECYQVKDLEDAVQELWRRRDIADRDLITSLRAAAGLPTQDEIFSISPYSDDDDSEPVKAKTAGSLNQTEGSCHVNQPGIWKHKFVDEVMGSDEERKPRFRIKSNKTETHDSEEETGKKCDKTPNVKGKKLVINLGPRKINVTNSPRSDTSSCQRDQDLVSANEGKIKLGKVKPEGSELNPTSSRGNIADGCESVPLVRPRRIFLGKRNTEGVNDQVGAVRAISRGERTFLGKQSEGRSDTIEETDDNTNHTPSHSLPKESKPLLRFKIKKPSIESQNSSPPQEDEKTTIKGQRSKRKRPSPFMEKASNNEDEDVAQSHQDGPMDEIMDANWILMKLGKDAIGKRVEVHQTSDNSWHKGAVTDVIEGTSKISVTLEDGKVKTLELRKQGVRFVPQKQKRSKA